MRDIGAATCPSGRCRPGATLLGIKGPDGRVIYTPGTGPLDQESAAVFESRGGSAIGRFSEPCLESGCAHWVNESCEVAAAAAAQHRDEPEHGLPNCGIRAQCRWFEQEGGWVCGICPQVFRSALPATG